MLVCSGIVITQRRNRPSQSAPPCGSRRRCGGCLISPPLRRPLRRRSGRGDAGRAACSHGCIGGGGCSGAAAVANSAACPWTRRRRHGATCGRRCKVVRVEVPWCLRGRLRPTSQPCCCAHETREDSSILSLTFVSPSIGSTRRPCLLSGSRSECGVVREGEGGTPREEVATVPRAGRPLMDPHSATLTEGSAGPEPSGLDFSGRRPAAVGAAVCDGKPREEDSPRDEEDSPRDEEDSPRDEEHSPRDEEDSPRDVSGWDLPAVGRRQAKRGGPAVDGQPTSLPATQTPSHFPRCSPSLLLTIALYLPPSARAHTQTLR